MDLVAGKSSGVSAELEEAYRERSIPVPELVARIWRYLLADEDLVEGLLSPTVLTLMELYADRSDDSRLARKDSVRAGERLVYSSDPSMATLVGVRVLATPCPEREDRPAFYVAELLGLCTKVAASWELPYLVGCGFRVGTVAEAISLEERILTSARESVAGSSLRPFPEPGMSISDWGSCVGGAVRMLSGATDMQPCR